MKHRVTRRKTRGENRLFREAEGSTVSFVRRDGRCNKDLFTFIPGYAQQC